MRGGAFSLFLSIPYYREYSLLPVRCVSQHQAQPNSLQQGCIFDMVCPSARIAHPLIEYLLFVLLLRYSSSSSIVVVNVVSFLPASTYLVPFSHSF